MQTEFQTEKKVTNWDCFLNVVPVAKGRPRHGNGFTYTPAKTRSAERMISQLVQSKQPHYFEGPIAITIVFHLIKPKSARKRMWPNVMPDIDNYEKLVLDALNGVCYKDDSQIVMKYSEKKYSEKTGIYIKIRPVLDVIGPACICSHG